MCNQVTESRLFLHSMTALTFISFIVLRVYGKHVISPVGEPWKKQKIEHTTVPTRPLLKCRCSVSDSAVAKMDVRANICDCDCDIRSRGYTTEDARRSRRILYLTFFLFHFVRLPLHEQCFSIFYSITMLKSKWHLLKCQGSSTASNWREAIITPRKFLFGIYIRIIFF